MINFNVSLITDIFDVYNIETALPHIDLEAIETHLMAAKEEEQKVSFLLILRASIKRGTHKLVKRCRENAEIRTRKILKKFCGLFFCC